ncbi:cleft lip and palate transmembrane protein 1-domain-containing protein [Globomyces pollinis-pini]|nr:cleft lip and palate transmembrane protein 1-domain-containing protein [Globomyces pollinis-pini]
MSEPSNALTSEPVPATNNQQEQNQGFWSNIFSQVPRMLLMYFLANSAMNMFFKPSVTPTTTVPDAAHPTTNEIGNLHAAWKLGSYMDVYFYADSNPTFSSFDDDSKLIYKQSKVKFGDFNDVREATVTIPCTPEIQNNGSLYGHFYLTRPGKSPSFYSKEASESTIYHRKLLTRYMPKKKVIRKKNLINDENEGKDVEEDVEIPNQIVSYWWPNVTMNIVALDSMINLKSLPPKIIQQIRLDETGTQYFPIFYTNDFWMLTENLMLINSTVQELNMTITFEPLSMWKFQLYTQFEESFRMQTEMMGVDKSETEQIKRMFLDTNPILLGITVLVSVLHSVFDFLAFKNDIKFWKDKKDMEGLSFRAIILNVIFQTIIFLYLLDNDTSYMVLFSTGAGLLIEFWKINKTVIIKQKATFPYLDFIDRYKPSKLTAKTQKYDQMAFNYLSYAFFPLMVLYTIYSVMYETHKSWYSFVLGTLVGFVYTFGFISMTPQLFINYKLKSVANMPWKTFMYKALNTFIDDLFAFVIKMPWLHRLACLRDDIVFFVYLYQRWIYPEDKRRRNEFGQVGEEIGEDNDDESESEGDEPVPKAIKEATESNSKLVHRKAQKESTTTTTTTDKEQNKLPNSKKTK